MADRGSFSGFQWGIGDPEGPAETDPSVTTVPTPEQLEAVGRVRNAMTEFNNALIEAAKQGLVGEVKASKMPDLMRHGHLYRRGPESVVVRVCLPRLDLIETRKLDE